MRATRLGLAWLAILWPLAGWGWEEQRVLAFVLAYPRSWRPSGR